MFARVFKAVAAISQVNKQETAEEGCRWLYATGRKLTHRDRSLHLAVLSGVICSVSQEPQLAFLRYQPAGEFSVPVSQHTGNISF